MPFGDVENDIQGLGAQGFREREIGFQHNNLAASLLKRALNGVDGFGLVKFGFRVGRCTGNPFFQVEGEADA